MRDRASPAAVRCQRAVFVIVFRTHGTHASAVVLDNIRKPFQFPGTPRLRVGLAIRVVQIEGGWGALLLWGARSSSFLAAQGGLGQSASEYFPHGGCPTRHPRLKSKFIDRGDVIRCTWTCSRLVRVSFPDDTGFLPSAFCIRWRQSRYEETAVLFVPTAGSVQSYHTLPFGERLRLRSASTISSNPTGRFAPGGSRAAGCDSTAQASDAQDDRIARFSSVVRSGSLTTSCGWLKADAGWKSFSRSGSISAHGGACSM